VFTLGILSVDYTVNTGLQEVYTVENNNDEPAARRKVVSARVSQQLYDQVKASGISTADLLKIALGRVEPNLTPLNVNESIESDPAVLAKERELRLATLDRQIAEVRAPLDVSSRMDDLEGYVMVLEEHLSEVDSRLAAMSGVLQVVKRLDPRMGNVQRQIAWLMDVVMQAIPQHLYDLEHRVGLLAKRGQSIPSSRTAPGLPAR
jgi:hypothetical protein